MVSFIKNDYLMAKTVQGIKGSQDLSNSVISIRMIAIALLIVALIPGRVAKITL